MDPPDSNLNYLIYLQHMILFLRSLSTNAFFCIYVVQAPHSFVSRHARQVKTRSASYSEPDTDGLSFFLHSRGDLLRDRRFTPVLL